MRLFIAIDFPEDIKQNLESFLDLLPEKSSDVILTKIKDFHLTLKFLGEADEDKVPEITDKLDKIKFQPFKMTMENFGVFRERGGYIRVVWIGFSESPILTELQKNIEDSMAQIGFEKEQRMFSPHLTLARVKFYKNKMEFENTFKKIKVKPKEFEVKSFLLIKSTLTPEGPIYEPLKEFHLL